MTTPYWTIHPGPNEDFEPPPRIEYESILSWLEAWPPETTILLEGHDGAPSHLASLEALIDGLAMAPLVEEMFRR